MTTVIWDKTSRTLACDSRASRKHDGTYHDSSAKLITVKPDTNLTLHGKRILALCTVGDTRCSDAILDAIAAHREKAATKINASFKKVAKLLAQNRFARARVIALTSDMIYEIVVSGDKAVLMENPLTANLYWGTGAASARSYLELFDVSAVMAIGAAQLLDSATGGVIHSIQLKRGRAVNYQQCIFKSRYEIRKALQAEIRATKIVKSVDDQFHFHRNDTIRRLEATASTNPSSED